MPFLQYFGAMVLVYMTSVKFVAPAWFAVPAHTILLGSGNYPGAVRPVCRNVLLHASSGDTDKDAVDFANEETLLKVHLRVRENVPTDDAVAAVSRYSQSFPFAAVLPVQPLTYLPAESGVELKFMRKKTDIKSSIDGGIRFFVKVVNGNNDREDDDRDEDDNSPATGTSLLEVTAKRNSKGQTISKIMAEKLVVMAYVEGITGQAPEKYGAAPVDEVQVESIFHKWM